MALCKPDGNHRLPQSYEDLTGLDEQVSAGSRAVAALSLPPVKGNTTAVIDPILSGLFVHEAFGHLSEAMAYENQFAGSNEHRSSVWTRRTANFDGAAPEGHRGSYFTTKAPHTTTTPVKDGVLGRTPFPRTAGRVGEAPTGNARCLNYHYAPLSA